MVFYIIFELSRITPQSILDQFVHEFPPQKLSNSSSMDPKIEFEVPHPIPLSKNLQQNNSVYSEIDYS